MLKQATQYEVLYRPGRWKRWEHCTIVPAERYPVVKAFIKRQKQQKCMKVRRLRHGEE